jgi:hypothetical protein
VCVAVREPRLDEYARADELAEAIEEKLIEVSVPT